MLPCSINLLVRGKIINGNPFQNIYHYAILSKHPKVFLIKLFINNSHVDVILSNFTMATYRYSHVRLDGSMSIKKRQRIVDQFNNPTVSPVSNLIQ